MLVDGPKLNPLVVAGLLAPPNRFAPLLAAPNGELAAGPLAPAPNKEPDGAVGAGVLPNSPPPAVTALFLEASVEVPKTDLLDVVCPKSPPPPSERVA